MASYQHQAVIGFDLNASRVRGVSGPPGGEPAALPLEADHEDLPVALSLEGRSPVVGRAGLALRRRAPHLGCLDFLPHLGTPRHWQAGRHNLDAGQALEAVLARLQPLGQVSQGLVVALPAYLTAHQVNLLAAAALKARLPLLGSVAAPLATALAAFAEQSWFGPAVVVDVDDHALTVMTVAARERDIQALDTRVLAHLSLRAWKERMLAAVADRCIRQSRRDPRDSAAAEQTLYDGMEDAFDACRQGRMVELVVQTPTWYQNLILQPEELVRYCANLVRPVVEALEAVQEAIKPNEPPRVLLLTAAAGRLPGLFAGLQDHLRSITGGDDGVPPGESGADAPQAPVKECRLAVLPAGAAARAAHDLAGRFLRKELPAGHLGTQAPVPPPQPVEAGPARLAFRGQTYLLNRPSFVLGRQPSCDLVFDSETYPTVSAWHCEIVSDHRTFLLRDRSRHGTLVNGRPVSLQVVLKPGDWIRLGPEGPMLRFLGQPADPGRLMTTA